MRCVIALLYLYLRCVCITRCKLHCYIYAMHNAHIIRTAHRDCRLFICICKKIVIIIHTRTCTTETAHYIPVVPYTLQSPLLVIAKTKINLVCAVKFICVRMFGTAEVYLLPQTAENPASFPFVCICIENKLPKSFFISTPYTIIFHYSDRWIAIYIHLP